MFCLLDLSLLYLSLFRYVDMIANPEVADIFRKRAKVKFHVSSQLKKYSSLIARHCYSTSVLMGKLHMGLMGIITMLKYTNQVSKKKY